MSDDMKLHNLIKIDIKTGHLYTAGLLDRELLTVLNYLVTVTDCDGGQNTITNHNDDENSNLKQSIKTNTTSLKFTS
ncbi:unnamed protein product [Heterobilharzia americana]|nr:unnamed protein product [Heterobilharzia americana]